MSNNENKNILSEEQVAIYNSYVITLADGTQIICKGMNGTNYISEKEIDTSIFNNNLSTMKVEYRGTTEVYNDMIFVQQMKWMDGTYYLAFRPKTREEILMEKLSQTSADITDLQLAFAEMYETMILGGNV